MEVFYGVELGYSRRGWEGRILGEIGLEKRSYREFLWDKNIGRGEIYEWFYIMWWVLVMVFLVENNNKFFLNVV